MLKTNDKFINTKDHTIWRVINVFKISNTANLVISRNLITGEKVEKVIEHIPLNLLKIQVIS